LNKIKTTIWVSNLSQRTGEGILAKYFLEDFLLKNKKKIIEIKTFEQSFIYKGNNFFKNRIICNSSFFHKYFEPFYGIYHLWLNRDKNIVYINYLPLWNFITFLLLPKKTILGPVTGGSIIKTINSPGTFVRKYIFPILYRISLFIIKKKFNKIIFSTNLLKKYTSNSHNFFYILGYVYRIFSYKHLNYRSKKKYDLIFYYRNHPSKNNQTLVKIINKLSDKLKICVIGDHFISKNSNIFNFGFLERKKVLSLITNSKLSLATGENILSLFVIDSYNCGTKIIFDKNLMAEKIITSNNFLPIDTNNIDLSSKRINEFILDYKFRSDSYFKKFLIKKNIEINLFLSNFFLNL